MAYLRYTTIRHHNPDLHNNFHTTNYRNYLTEKDKCTVETEKITTENEVLQQEIENYIIPLEMKNRYNHELELSLLNYELTTKTRMLKQQNNIYNGYINVKDTPTCYLNLRKYEPTPKQVEFHKPWVKLSY